MSVLARSLVLLAVLLLTAAGARARPSLPEGDLFYHWQHRLSIGASDRRALARLDLAAGLVNAGRFRLVEGKPVFEGTGTARDLSGEKFPWRAHAVYLFGGSFRSWLGRNPEAAERFVARTIVADLERWRRRPAGVQFDLEGPASVLPAYARLLRHCRSALPPDLLVSCVSMTHWFVEPALHDVLASVDFFVPMLYNLGWGTRFSHEVEVSDPRWIRGLGERLEVFGKPYYVGIPTYSFCMCFDASGKRLFGWHRVSPGALANHPGLELLHARPNRTNLRVGDIDITRLANGLPLGQPLLEKGGEYAGDNVYTFRARRDVKVGSFELERGGFVVFNRVTAGGLSRYLQAVRGIRNAWCKGAALFRYATDRDPMALDARAWLAAYGLDDAHRTDVDLELAGEAGGRLRVRLSNVGHRESFLAEEAVGVDLLVEGSRPLSMSRGDFADLRLQELGEGRMRIRFLHPFLEPGRVLESGPIELASPPAGVPSVIRYRAWVREVDRMERSSDGRLLPVRSWIPSRSGARKVLTGGGTPWAWRSVDQESRRSS